MAMCSNTHIWINWVNVRLYFVRVVIFIMWCWSYFLHFRIYITHKIVVVYIMYVCMYFCCFMFWCAYHGVRVMLVFMLFVCVFVWTRIFFSLLLHKLMNMRWFSSAKKRKNENDNEEIKMCVEPNENELKMR